MGDKWSSEQFRQYARDYLNGDKSRYETKEMPPVRNKVIDAEIKTEREAFLQQKLKGKIIVEGKTLLVKVAYTIDVELEVSGEDLEKALRDTTPEDFEVIEKLREQAKEKADKYLFDGCPCMVIQCSQLENLEE